MILNLNIIQNIIHTVSLVFRHGYMKKSTVHIAAITGSIFSDIFSPELRVSPKPHKSATGDKNNYKETQNNCVIEMMKMPQEIKQSDHKFITYI